MIIYTIQRFPLWITINYLFVCTTLWYIILSRSRRNAFQFLGLTYAGRILYIMIFGQKRLRLRHESHICLIGSNFFTVFPQLFLYQSISVYMLRDMCILCNRFMIEAIHFQLWSNFWMFDVNQQFVKKGSFMF